MHWTEVIGIERRLRIQPGGRLAVVNAPPGSDSMFPMASGVDPESANAIVGFVACRTDLDRLEAVYSAARADRVAWVSYPKPGRMVTDVRRDWLARAVRQIGFEAVTHVSIDHNWSALLLRPIPDGVCAAGIDSARAGSSSAR